MVIYSKARRKACLNNKTTISQNPESASGFFISISMDDFIIEKYTVVHICLKKSFCKLLETGATFDYTITVEI